MKICVATYATGSYAALCDLTDKNKADYCSLRGYGFERNHVDAAAHCAFFDRYAWYQSIMKDWDWLYCLDADAIFTNFKKTLEEIIKPSDTIIFPLDAVMVQAGGFLARNCAETRQFFAEIISKGGGPWKSDQIEIEWLIPKYKHLIRCIPQRTLGSYRYEHYRNLGGNYLKQIDREGNDGQWQPGDFVLHAPGMPMESKLALLSWGLSQVVR